MVQGNGQARAPRGDLTVEPAGFAPEVIALLFKNGID